MSGTDATSDAGSATRRIRVPARGPDVERPDPARANAFDLLRLVGAMLVLVEHSWLLVGLEFPLLAPSSGTTFGRIGVGVFFLTSGYLIASSWTADPSPHRFLARRALRIYPLYALVVVLLALAVGPPLSTLPASAYYADPQTWRYLGNNLLVFSTEFSLPGVFTDAPAPGVVNGVLWTIPTEIMCYLGVLALGLVGVIRRRWLVLAVAVALLGVAVVVGISGYEGTLVPRLLDARGAEQIALFGVGVLAFVFRERWRPAWWPGLVAALVWLIASGTPVADPAAVLSIALLTLAVAFRAPSALRHPTGGYDLSYGVYLIAYPVQQVLVQAGIDNPWANLALTVVIVVPLAALTWRFVERPALRLKPRRPQPDRP